jgi:hypothetical protein
LTLIPKVADLLLTNIQYSSDLPAYDYDFKHTRYVKTNAGFVAEGWNGFIQPIEGMIGSFDCAINLTEYDKAGCYIDEEMFRGFN